MKHHLAALVAMCSATVCSNAVAGEATVVWYDPTCRYFVMQLPEGSEGFGLFEWKDGPEPTEASVISGDVLGGPELKVTYQASSQQMSVIHWGDAKSKEVLIRHSPEWCKSKRKRR